MPILALIGGYIIASFLTPLISLNVTLTAWSTLATYGFWLVGVILAWLGIAVSGFIFAACTMMIVALFAGVLTFLGTALGLGSRW